MVCFDFFGKISFLNFYLKVKKKVVVVFVFNVPPIAKVIWRRGHGLKVSNGTKIRNRYNQVPHLTQDTNGKVTNSQKTPQTRAKRSALSQQVTTKHI